MTRRINVFSLFCTNKKYFIYRVWKTKEDVYLGIFNAEGRYNMFKTKQGRSLIFTYPLFSPFPIKEQEPRTMENDLKSNFTHSNKK